MFSENIHITYMVGVRFQILKLRKSKARCERQRWNENKVKFRLSPPPRKLSKIQVLAQIYLEWYSLWLGIML